MDSEKLLCVSEKLQKVLSKVKEAAGYIAGYEEDNNLFCLSVALCKDYFISGIKLLGIYCVINAEETSENELLITCREHLRSLEVELQEPVVLFVYKNNKDLQLDGKIYSSYYNSFTNIKLESQTDNLLIFLRAQGKFPFLYEASPDLDVLKESIELSIEKLRTTIQSEVSAFLLHDSKLLINSSEDSKKNIKCGNFFKFVTNEDIVEMFKKSKKNSKQKVPLIFDILIQISGEAALQNNVSHSVVIHCQQKNFQCATLSLPIDVIVACSESCSTYSVYKLFTDAIQNQLQKMSKCLLKYAEDSEHVVPVPYHFYPDSCEIPFTIIYPLSKSDAELEKYRRSFHELLILPMDRPIIRKLNKYDFSWQTSAGYLVNPHEGLQSSGASGGKTAVVYGRYSYHHYMQDHMNDDGWGCAYRSLQTIISWFRFQGYTEKPIPSHTEIQQALVDIGDKPKSFVGTKKWIGSQEVSFCLDHLIQIQSKILFVNSGAELANKSRELLIHFQDQGTPIMIGGGVYAHTILGVDFNENTGDVKFLILDPHYTGGEDLNVILNKGWCGWKGPKFWDQNAFYNLCMPQRSLQI